MMVMDSIKFRSVHLMDDGDGHHNFGIDGDGDGHHFKGDGCHVWRHAYSSPCSNKGKNSQFPDILARCR